MQIYGYQSLFKIAFQAYLTSAVALQDLPCAGSCCILDFVFIYRAGTLFYHRKLPSASPRAFY